MRPSLDFLFSRQSKLSDLSHSSYISPSRCFNIFIAIHRCSLKDLCPYYTVMPQTTHSIQSEATPEHGREEQSFSLTGYQRCAWCIQGYGWPARAHYWFIFNLLSNRTPQLSSTRLLSSLSFMIASSKAKQTKRPQPFLTSSPLNFSVKSLWKDSSEQRSCQPKLLALLERLTWVSSQGSLGTNGKKKIDGNTKKNDYWCFILRQKASKLLMC